MTRTRTEWLTVPDVCADLQVSESEWHTWRARGDTPLHIAMPGGQLRVRVADYERWLSDRTGTLVVGQVPQARTRPRTGAGPYPYGEPAQWSLSGAASPPDPYSDPYAYGEPGLRQHRPLSAYWRQRIRDAIDATGDRGLGRAEIWTLLSHGKTGRQVGELLAELLASQAYEEITIRTGGPGRPPVRYRRKPSRTAGNVASVADESDASPRAGHDASRSTTAERDGGR